MCYFLSFSRRVVWLCVHSSKQTASIFGSFVSFNVSLQLTQITSVQANGHKSQTTGVPSQSGGDLNLEPNLFLLDFDEIITQTHIQVHTPPQPPAHLPPAHLMKIDLFTSLCFFSPHKIFLCSVSSTLPAMFSPWNKWHCSALNGEGRYRRYCYSHPLSLFF